MKKITSALIQTLCCFFISILPMLRLNAQLQLMGMGQYGGTADNGTIFSINLDGADLKPVFEFNGINGRIPHGSLTQASNGFLYGMTVVGGKYGNGTIFKIKADGTGHVVIHHFDYLTGNFPSGSLLQANDGLLYGQSYSGGFFQKGTVFKIHPDGSGFQIIHHFNGNDGGLSYGSLIQGGDGMLYGTGLGNTKGTVFRLNTDGTKFQLLHSFNGNPGGPFGTLVQATNSLLYGYLGYGGEANGGAIYKINPDGSGFEILHHLSYGEGIRPQSSLIQAPDGYLYGMTYEGGTYNKGTIIRIAMSGDNFAVLHHFDGIGGAHPAGVLTAHNNQLYGFASQDGLNGLGVIFKYDLGSNLFTKIGDFTYETGNWPWYGSPVVVDLPDLTRPTIAAHTLTFSDVLAKSMNVSFIPGNGSYHLVVMKAGSAPTFKPIDNQTYKGSLGNGNIVVYNGTESSFDISALKPDTEYYFSIFEYNSAGTTIQYKNDGNPIASQHTKTAHEEIYGTASDGGASLGGAVFRFDPDRSNSLNAVFNFKNTTGLRPWGSVIEANDGFLYGTTTGGNTAPYGNIFKVSPDGKQYTVLHELMSNEGTHPRGPLLQASNKFLYGAGHFGGQYFAGTIFMMRPDGSGFRVIHHFNIKDGQQPNAPLLQASNGVLYGMTSGGGEHASGVIYRINLNGSGYKVLYNFGWDERYPDGTLIEGLDGLLYGVASGGNSDSPGAVFKISKDGSGYQQIHTFIEAKDGFPRGTLLQLPDGTLYGLAEGDASQEIPGGFGNIFKIQPDGSGYEKVHSFVGTDGYFPKGRLLYHDHKLFGYTWQGGEANNGVIFSYDLATKFFKKLYNLNRASGTHPFNGGLIVVNTPDRDVNFIVSPKNHTVYLPLTLDLTANAVEGATQYTIEINPDPAFGTSTALTSKGPRKQTFSNLKLGTKYYTRVKTDVTPNWGETRDFTTGDLLTLAYVISPYNNAQNVSYYPMIEVNRIPGAKYYTIQLSVDPSFNRIDYERTGLTPKVSFNWIGQGTTYYARVKTDLVPDYGPVRKFTTGTALSLSYVISPGNNSTGAPTKLTVKSNIVPQARQYTMQLSEKADFSTIAFEGSSTTTNVVFEGLKYNTRYFNRVRTDRTTTFGVVRSFVTRTASSIAYVTSPSDGASNVPTDGLTITSNPVPGASIYTIQLSESNTFDQLSFEKSGASRSITFSGLKNNTTYYNRVLTDLTTVYGQVRSFTTIDMANQRSRATAEAGEENPVIAVNPNPFDDLLNIFIRSEGDQANLALIDGNGKTLHEWLQKTNRYVQIHLRVSKGIYYLKIQTTENIQVLKLIKI